MNAMLSILNRRYARTGDSRFLRYEKEILERKFAKSPALHDNNIWRSCGNILHDQDNIKSATKYNNFYLSYYAIYYQSREYDHQGMNSFQWFFLDLSS